MNAQARKRGRFVSTPARDESMNKCYENYNTEIPVKGMRKIYCENWKGNDLQPIDFIEYTYETVTLRE